MCSVRMTWKDGQQIAEATNDKALVRISETLEPVSAGVPDPEPGLISADAFASASVLGGKIGKTDIEFQPESGPGDGEIVLCGDNTTKTVQAGGHLPSFPDTEAVWPEKDKDNKTRREEYVTVTVNAAILAEICLLAHDLQKNPKNRRDTPAITLRIPKDQKTASTTPLIFQANYGLNGEILSGLLMPFRI